MRSIVAILLAVALLGIVLFNATSTDAKIYKWVDRHGTVHFSDRPFRVPGKDQEQFRSRRPLPKKQTTKTLSDGRVRPPASILRNAVWIPVERVVDGDTIKLSNGEKVRLLGIDAPESKHPKKVADPCGAQSSKLSRNLMSGQDVTLEFDEEKKDRYGRLLAHVYTRSTFINAEIIRRGYARVSTYKPNLKYRDFFLSLQKQAKKGDRGLWGEC